MKVKIFNKKLKLNKKTIADLNKNDLKEVYGGKVSVRMTFCTCTICHKCKDD